ncbi:MAG: indolepyruvate oxidoreductase subunit beta family protein [Alphaproteobacteria bacterium]|nr:indolepyruvate oxidoreductase subunit beta family protein [Alphaproteobacteria bacterium]MBU0795226.1 indolepyruvate oxidoreductase subunit beta family protein [Alphaproteobacteria bacterium]MBU0876668.1 indolepyruvate oxidoreductase subunit beta family protein [Alphaproteobacteria bacterium]MBU1769370.1 indolepyruvate oxidoreductase subunit beta family protein [Alphaproteobacteria bacterium]
MRDETVKLRLDPAGEATERPISIAIVAMGGQGGGVLTGWIVKLAEAAGWVAQSTSVPGVAQRTGATIYYVEMMQPSGGRLPILAQMPTPGDVDVVLASEFIEAGRSILRGIVTPDRTTLIASSHRSLAIAEKSAPGEGIADDSAVTEAIGITARRSIIFDMNALATAHGSVISSAMFGALAAADVLPFPVDAYHAVIKGEGKGGSASIKAFDAAFARTEGKTDEADADPAPAEQATPLRRPIPPRIAGLLDCLQTVMPPQVQPMARAGLAKVIDFQDVAYGSLYLTKLEEILRLDVELAGESKDFALTFNAAKYLANAMAYDDVIRVADLKTRSTRLQRIGKEIGLGPGQLFETTEYMHPRMEELVGLAPARLGRWLRRQDRLYAWLDRRISKGRRVRTYSPGWFLVLYTMAGLRRFRRASLRHAEEAAHRDAWLTLATKLAPHNYALGVEVVKCQRLIKGYSDTHARGLSKFDRAMSEIRRLAHRDDAADWARRLRETAVRDGEGGDFDGLIQTIRSVA